MRDVRLGRLLGLRSRPAVPRCPRLTARRSVRPPLCRPPWGALRCGAGAARRPAGWVVASRRVVVVDMGTNIAFCSRELEAKATKEVERKLSR